MDRACDPRPVPVSFVDYQVPAVVRCRTSDGLSVVARVSKIEPDALFVDTTHGELSYGEQVRVVFVTSATPAVGVDGFVVSIVRGRGVRIELHPETSPGVFEIMSEWAEGRPATVSTPLEPSSHERLGPPPLPPPLPDLGRARLSGRRVLVIDDDPLVLRALERLLGHLGAEVTTTRHPPEGLVLAEEKQVDAVLVEWTLPEVPGPALLAQLHRARAGVPVAVISGALWWEGAERQIHDLGAEAVLRKPLDIDELAGWIESVRPTHVV